MPRLGLGLGLAKGSVLPTIDAEALALYNRVIADGGIIPAGLDGCNNYIKSAKAARGISTLAQGYLSLAHPQYTGIRLATGTGPTAGNRAARTVYNALGSTGDFIQTAAANQPLALVHSGTNYVWLPGVAWNYFSTPSATANELTNDFSFEAKIKPNILTGVQVIIAKDGGAPGFRQFQFRPNDALLQLVVDNGTQVGYNSTINVPFTANQTFFVRCSRVSSSGSIQFFTSANGTTWTQLGANVTGITGALSNPDKTIEIGSTAVVAGLFQGEIFYVNTYKDSTFTTPTQIFNPASYNRATSQTSRTSSTGEVWTLNTPATNNALKAAIVDTTMIMGNGTSYGMQAASLNINQNAITSYTAFRKFVNTAGGQIITETGQDLGTYQGVYHVINAFASTEWIGVNGNVGLYINSFSSSSLNLKLATKIVNVNNANEASPYLINNSNSTLDSNISSANNSSVSSIGYNVFARNNASSAWANVFLVSDCVVIDEDNSTQQTSMYNFFKSYINGI